MTNEQKREAYYLNLCAAIESKDQDRIDVVINDNPGGYPCAMMKPYDTISVITTALRIEDGKTALRLTNDLMDKGSHAYDECEDTPLIEMIGVERTFMLIQNALDLKYFECAKLLIEDIVEAHKPNPRDVRKLITFMKQIPADINVGAMEIEYSPFMKDELYYTALYFGWDVRDDCEPSIKLEHPPFFNEEDMVKPCAHSLAEVYTLIRTALKDGDFKQAYANVLLIDPSAGWPEVEDLFQLASEAIDAKDFDTASILINPFPNLQVSPHSVRLLVDLINRIPETATSDAVVKLSPYRTKYSNLLKDHLYYRAMSCGWHVERECHPFGASLAEVEQVPWTEQTRPARSGIYISYETLRYFPEQAEAIRKILLST